MGRRINIKPNDVLQLGDKLRIARQLKGPDTVRLKLVRPPDPLNRADADPDLLGHGRCGPMGDFARRLLPGSFHHPIDDRLRQGRNARRSRLIAQQPVDPGLHKPLLPAPDRRLRFSGPSHDLDRAQAIRSHQDDRRPPNMFLRAVPVRHDRRQTRTISRTHVDLDPFSHVAKIAQLISKGNPMLDLIH